MLIKNTPQYSKWKSIIIGARKFPLDKHIEELQSLHETRKSRNLYNGRFNSNRLIEASALDMHMRSRTVELMTRAKRLSYDIYRANDAMKAFLFAKNLVGKGTAGDRTMRSNQILEKGLSLASDLDSFIETCEILIADADAAGWTLKRISELLVIASRPEATL